MHVSAYTSLRQDTSFGALRQSFRTFSTWQHARLQSHGTSDQVLYRLRVHARREYTILGDISGSNGGEYDYDCRQGYFAV
jgi:hypothetical protein